VVLVFRLPDHRSPADERFNFRIHPGLSRPDPGPSRAHPTATSQSIPAQSQSVPTTFIFRPNVSTKAVLESKSHTGLPVEGGIAAIRNIAAHSGQDAQGLQNNSDQHIHQSPAKATLASSHIRLEFVFCQAEKHDERRK
jgi:hypothetical protein